MANSLVDEYKKLIKRQEESHESNLEHINYQIFIRAMRHIRELIISNHSGVVLRNPTYSVNAGNTRWTIFDENYMVVVNPYLLEKVELGYIVTIPAESARSLRKLP